MKKTTRIFLGLTVLALAGMIIYSKRSRRQKNDDSVLSQVSDEGYETAHDVLFPDKFKKDGNLRYGPILPR